MRKNQGINEKCAVFGVSLNVPEAAGVVYNGLLALQHRGQEGAGIAVAYDNDIKCVKNMGLVCEVFSRGVLSKLAAGKVAVGHTRYSTTGDNRSENAGPFVTEYLTGRLATAHNGNITNAAELRGVLKKRGVNFGATSDSEVLSAFVAYYITRHSNAVKGIERAAQYLKGAFSVVIATGKGKLIALRDPYGYRPLCLGVNKYGYAFASESCALDVCGFSFIRDVKPGEIIVIQDGKIIYEGVKLKREENSERGLCVFEYVYFARPDSNIDGLSVHNARFNMGVRLAKEHHTFADVVCGVPDSGLEAASGYAAESGIPLASGFVKNRYIGRSFIYPTQLERDNAVLQKLNPLAANIKGKRVVLVDDSIVRGTTSEKLVRNLKNAGAKEIHMRISSPPFLYTCHYGTDIDDEENLIANKLSVNEICAKIGADSLGYISIEGLKEACGGCTLPFCTACFTGADKELSDKKDIFERKL